MFSRAEVYRIYVCGISPNVEQCELEYHFSQFGNICDCRFEPTSNYALISYTNQKDAILALAKGHMLNIGNYEIIVEWARGWPINKSRRKNFGQIFDETSSNNSTVYINGLEGQNSRETLESIFSPFGTIEEIITNGSWSDYALIRFSDKWNAALAICTIDGTRVGGIPVSCTWSYRANTQSLTSGGHHIGFAVERVPMQAPPLPPTSNSTMRTQAAASSVPTPSATTPSATTPSATTSASSSSTLSRTSTESNTSITTPVASELLSLSSDTSYMEQFVSLMHDFRELSSSIRSLNSIALSPSTSTTNQSNFSESSALVNEEYTNDDFDIVFNQTRLNNCTVYCKGLSLNTTNESLKNIFSPFGIIEEIGLHIDRSDYALIRFNTKDAATLAICSINNTKINGCRVTCTWSNRPNDQNQQTQGATVSQSPVTTSTQLSSQAALSPYALPFALPLTSSHSTAPVLTKEDKAVNPEKKKEKSSDIFCKICMDEELGVVFLPCGHLTACAKCAQQIFTCPLCRKIITSKVRTYLA